MSSVAEQMYSGHSENLKRLVGNSALPVSRDAWEAFRSAFRSLGPRHRWVDRWRHDLRWIIPEQFVAAWLAPERAKFVEKPGHA